MCNLVGQRPAQMQAVNVKYIQCELGAFAPEASLNRVHNGFDYTNSPILVKAGEDKIDVLNAHWEFIPPWIKNLAELATAPKQAIPWLNARAETLLSSKMFRQSALHRRCVVPVSYFFEWRHFKPEGEKKEKAYPYIIELRGRDYFFMAGIYTSWTDKDTGEMLDCFAIITTKANALMEQVHNKKKRMPTILTEDLAWEWIMEPISEQRIAEIAGYQIAPELMSAYPIAREFKILENPCEAFDYEGLPALVTE